MVERAGVTQLARMMWVAGVLVAGESLWMLRLPVLRLMSHVICLHSCCVVVQVAVKALAVSAPTSVRFEVLQIS